MSNLKEIKAAMPADFVKSFQSTAESLGMTHRQLAATCIALGFKSFSNIDDGTFLPSFEIGKEENNPPRQINNKDDSEATKPRRSLLKLWQ